MSQLKQKASIMVIRKYNHDTDWERICEIHDLARPGELEGSASKEAFIPLQKCYKEEELFNDEIFVGKINNTIGFVAFNHHDISWLYIHPNYQKKGYGRQLLQFAIKKTQRPTKVVVLNKNFKAISLYKSEGFIIAKTKTGKIPLTNVGATAHRMIKKNN
tara:strand:+ start:213 stop:692 length:480 start_codon:yes stop_codon:yes gene_type:complete